MFGKVLACFGAFWSVFSVWEIFGAFRRVLECLRRFCSVWEDCKRLLERLEEFPSV